MEDKMATWILTIGVSVFVIRHITVYEDIHYFSNEMIKGQFLSQAMGDKKEDCSAELFNKFKLNMLWFFLDEKIFCFDHMANSQNVVFSAPTRETDSNESQYT